ncbi:MAG: hypothetical protein MJE68_20805 [Proteobacteria bacterium]|nr:hypothetical protein [Pseudomonadota bacterium]
MHDRPDTIIKAKRAWSQKIRTQVAISVPSLPQPLSSSYAYGNLINSHYHLPSLSSKEFNDYNYSDVGAGLEGRTNTIELSAEIFSFDKP